MKLKNAKLCLDDDEIYDSKFCPICCGAQYIYLSRIVKPLYSQIEYELKFPNVNNTTKDAG